MKNQLLLFVVLFCIAPLLASLPAFAQQSAPPPAPMTAKQLEAMAKALVDEGKSLEKKGELGEAREKFLDAEGYFSTKAALDGLNRVREAVQQKAESLLEEARPSCEKQSLSDCIGRLEKALEPGPEKTAALHNNLALYYQKLGDRARAMAHVDALLATTHEEKERLKLAELRTSV